MRFGCKSARFSGSLFSALRRLFRFVSRTTESRRRTRAHDSHQELPRHHRNDLCAHDVAHRTGEHLGRLRLQGPHYYDKFGMHFRLSRHRVGLRSDRIRQTDADDRGGCEELDATDAAIFDTLLPPAPTGTTIRRIPLALLTAAATALLSAKARAPSSSRSSEHARARGARIYAEILGYGTNADGEHITSPASEQMAAAMRLALDDAGLAPKDIDLINGHGTATDRGDLAESKATYDVFGGTVPLYHLQGPHGTHARGLRCAGSDFCRSRHDGGVCLPPFLILKIPTLNARLWTLSWAAFVNLSKRSLCRTTLPSAGSIPV